uniref:Uncharacterized protein n=1 Tax=Trichuris muris TaxID=70415 RepID=A0A5S6Q7G2_TRIMR
MELPVELAALFLADNNSHIPTDLVSTDGQDCKSTRAHKSKVQTLQPNQLTNEGAKDCPISDLWNLPATLAAHRASKHQVIIFVGRCQGNVRPQVGNLLAPAVPARFRLLPTIAPRRWTTADRLTVGNEFTELTESVMYTSYHDDCTGSPSGLDKCLSSRKTTDKRWQQGLYKAMVTDKRRLHSGSPPTLSRRLTVQPRAQRATEFNRNGPAGQTARSGFCEGRLGGGAFKQLRPERVADASRLSMTRQKIGLNQWLSC